METAKKYDSTTQNFFENQLKSDTYAAAKDVLRMERAKPLTSYRKEFLRGARGQRDGKRAAVFLEAIQLRNAEAHVLEYFLAIALCGFKGTIVPHDLNASMCSEITSSRCGERSFRGAVSSLEKKGWLSKVLIPTGRIVATAVDESGNESKHKLLKVCKISVTPAARLLIARKGMCDKPLPRQKMPVAVLSNKLNQEGTSLRSLPDSSVCDIDNNKLTSRARQSSGTVENDVRPTSEPLKAAHVGQQLPRQARKARKPAKKRGLVLGRKIRNKARGTWSANRSSFLHDLYCVTKNDAYHRIASLQTDLQYPPLLPEICNWNQIIFSWHEHNRREARRIIERDILPDLKAFAANLLPPNPVDLGALASHETRQRAQDQMAAFKRLRGIFTNFSESLISDDMPAYLVEKITSQSWSIGMVPWMLISGKFALSDLSTREKEVFRDIADSLGGID